MPTILNTAWVLIGSYLFWYFLNVSPKLHCCRKTWKGSNPTFLQWISIRNTCLLVNINWNLFSFLPWTIARLLPVAKLLKLSSQHQLSALEIDGEGKVAKTKWNRKRWMDDSSVTPRSQSFHDWWHTRPFFLFFLCHKWVITAAVSFAGHSRTESWFLGGLRKGTFSCFIIMLHLPQQRMIFFFVCLS